MTRDDIWPTNDNIFAGFLEPRFWLISICAFVHLCNARNVAWLAAGCRHRHKQHSFAPTTKRKNDHSGMFFQIQNYDSLFRLGSAPLAMAQLTDLLTGLANIIRFVIRRMKPLVFALTKTSCFPFVVLGSAPVFAFISLCVIQSRLDERKSHNHNIIIVVVFVFVTPLHPLRCRPESQNDFQMKKNVRRHCERWCQKRKHTQFSFRMCLLSACSSVLVLAVYVAWCGWNKPCRYLFA